MKHFLERIPDCHIPIAWDEFHRINKAGRRSLNNSKLGMRFFNVLKDIAANFGGGQGRALDCQFAEFWSEKRIANRVVAGTREFGYLTECPRRYLQKLPSYINLCAVRSEHSRRGLDGAKRTDNRWWVEFGHTLTDPEFICYLLFLSGVLEAVQPYVG